MKAARYMGRPCRNGHDGERYAQNGRCVSCCAVAQRKNRWRLRNPEKHAANFAAWRVLNIERDRINSRLWQKQNHAKVVAAIAGRKAARLKATPRWCDLSAVRSVYDVATRLTISTGIQHHVDHIVPLQGAGVCGLHVPWNLRPIPALENKRKGNRQVVGW